VQVFADQHGNVVAVGERDCSVQRRHQKLIEETPSPAVTPEIRQGLFDASIALARAVDYRGAGTCEFLLAGDGRFYFLEMNTRIQVEHTVTEEVTGFDLVKEQILVAGGAPLSFTQADVRPRGHAIQCRINAEDAGRDFKPTPGVVSRFRPPDGFGIRVDSAMEDGGAILPTYDSLLAKLVAWGRDRDEAIDRMSRALAEFEVGGVPTTIPFHANVLRNDAFRRGDATTAFLPAHPEVLPPPSEVAGEAAEDAPGTTEILVEINNRRFNVRLPEGIAADGARGNGAKPSGPAKRRGAARVATAEAGPDVISPIQGTVIRVAVTEGQTVAPGTLICVIEAMKMENEITALREGVVSALPIAPGQAVTIGTLLATIS
jgi:acetyl-CoA/propionyl-CoA carboxylase biotin carboxyl carrier protein